MKPRKAVSWFAQEMEAKLRENDHKSGWQGCRFALLFPRIREETDELLVKAHPLQLDTIAEKLSAEDACELIRECADIANFAMMIADNIRIKREQATEKPHVAIVGPIEGLCPRDGGPCEKAGDGTRCCAEPKRY